MPFKSLLKSHLGDILALCGLVVVIALITSIILMAPPLTSSGPLSATDHTILVLLVTVAGTTFSALIASRIRHLMLQLADSTLQRWINPSGNAPARSVALARLDKKWRGILAIDSISEKFGNLPIVLVYLFCALITTSIVTTFTPVTYVRTLSYHPLMPDANYGYDETCVYMVNSSFEDPRPYSWSLPNGSHFFIPANAGGCPTRLANILCPNINSISPNKFAYLDQGVAVETGAIGAPASIYSSQPDSNVPLEQLLQSHGSFILNTTQCVPVMVKNPFQCRPGGKIQYNGGNDSIGKGTTVLTGNYGYGPWLASFINDPNGNVSVTPGYSYGVTCAVDASDVFAYRKVILSFQGSNIGVNSSFARTLSSSGEECQPLQPTISNILFATVAGANWQLLIQNQGIDGLTDSLSQITGSWRKPPYAFTNSQNPLEDSLGLVAALVVSRVNNSGNYVPAEDSKGEYAYVQATRLGTGKRETLLLLIPLVTTTIVLLSLIIMSFKDGQGQSQYQSLPSDAVGKDSIPYTESLLRLIGLAPALEPGTRL
ncbi:hypothetical protein L207DRAFT_623102 [Hyaloscypha variabilis F]|uniref:Uncharacterized protein n=1 Tax=Hyaloscypha variabilis (strain UAMH 11265 / GT02V1 / F) TaxID=1149755 RepID=A0A2J6RWF9_HYAVF|nr:hypothetical protein L207DRAFT_623102 [Hyaloscypha variabilis F]